MKLAFSGQGKYAKFDEAYDTYVKRSRKGDVVDKKTYKRAIKKYCSLLAQRLIEEGIVDLPMKLGSISAVNITRKPQYRGKKFVGYGKMDWKKGHYDGKLKTFGMSYLPRRGKNSNLRSYGYVANRELFKKMKNKYETGEAGWKPMEFNDEMI